METLDDIFSCLTTLQSFTIQSEEYLSTVGIDVPNEGNDPRRVAEPRPEEPATHDAIGTDQRLQSGIVDGQRKTLHI